MQQERDIGEIGNRPCSLRSARMRRAMGYIGKYNLVCDAQWPAFNEEYLKEDVVNYTISFNGKARFTMEFPADAASDVIQAEVLADERSQKWTEGKTPKKVIVVPKKIVNVVI